MPITVLTVGKGNSRGAELMGAEWADKLRRCVGWLRGAKGRCDCC